MKYLALIFLTIVAFYSSFIIWVVLALLYSLRWSVLPVLCLALCIDLYFSSIVIGQYTLYAFGIMLLSELVRPHLYV